MYLNRKNKKFIIKYHEFPIIKDDPIKRIKFLHNLISESVSTKFNVEI